MVAVTQIGGTLRGRRWAIASETGAAGLTALSIRILPAPAPRVVVDRPAAEHRS